MWWDAMRSPTARWNHPKAVENTVPWKPWKTKPRFPTAPTAPWKTRNLGEFPTFPPPCDSLFPSLKKTKGQEGSMKQADRSSVNKSGQIQKLPTVLCCLSASLRGFADFLIPSFCHPCARHSGESHIRQRPLHCRQEEHRSGRTTAQGFGRSLSPNLPTNSSDESKIKLQPQLQGPRIASARKLPEVVRVEGHAAGAGGSDPRSRVRKLGVVEQIKAFET